MRRARALILAMLATPAEAYRPSAVGVRQRGGGLSSRPRTPVRVAMVGDATAAPAGASSDAADEDGETLHRKFELCLLDASGEIEECQMLTADELTDVMSPEQALAVLNDAESAGLFFASPHDQAQGWFDGGRGVSGLTPGGVRYVMLADWEVRECIEEEEDDCRLPQDVLLRAMGPRAKEQIQQELSEGEDEGNAATAVAAAAAAADAAASEGEASGVKMCDRFHMHFGAGRLGMGLVVPAISASGIPFAVVQRPKQEWSAMFSQASRGTGADQVDVRVNDVVVVHNLAVRQ